MKSKSADEIADRAAEERSENEGMAEHADKAQDPARWAADRGRRVGLRTPSLPDALPTAWRGPGPAASRLASAAPNLLKQEKVDGQRPKAWQPRAKEAEGEARCASDAGRGGADAGPTYTDKETRVMHGPTGMVGMSKDPGRPNGASLHLEILFPAEADNSDEAVAERVLRALFSAAPMCRERIQVEIAKARVTLRGTVGTAEERVAVSRTIASVEGVLAIANLVTVEPIGRPTEASIGVAEAYGGDAESGDVAGRIEAVFARESDLGALKVLITAVGGKVTLSGQVHSWLERDLAERIAWASPGVIEVIDRITVS